MARQLRPVVITSGRHPFEVMVLVAAMVCGVALAVTGISTKATEAAMPGWVQIAWNFMLITGGSIGLLGIFSTARLIVRLGIEAAGVVVLGSACVMYAIAIFAVSGANGVPAGSFVTAIGIASLIRAWQIMHDIRRAVAASEHGDVGEFSLLTEEDT